MNINKIALYPVIIDGSAVAYGVIIIPSITVWQEILIMNTYFLIRKSSLSEEKAFGLDNSSVKKEKFLMVVNPPKSSSMARIILAIQWNLTQLNGTLDQG
jgi:hypothetical protein